VIRDIAGRQNHSVKLARKLQQKKHRREWGLLACEGMDLLEAGFEAGADIRDVLVPPIWSRCCLRDSWSGPRGVPVNPAPWT